MGFKEDLIDEINSLMTSGDYTDQDLEVLANNLRAPVARRLAAILGCMGTHRNLTAATPRAQPTDQADKTPPMPGQLPPDQF